MFLEFWKRKQAEIRYDWDVADYSLEEHMRPEFEAKCQHQRRNPITQACFHICSISKSNGLYLVSTLF